MLVTLYTLNMIVHSVMYSYYLASIYVKDLDKIVSVKKSITIMQMVSGWRCINKSTFTRNCVRPLSGSILASHG